MKAFISSLILCAARIALALPAADPPVRSWSPPEQVSDERSSWFPALAVTGDRVHLVWSTGKLIDPQSGQGRDELLYRWRAGGSWSEVSDIANPRETAFDYVTRSSIAADQDGVLHVLIRYANRIEHISGRPRRWRPEPIWTAPQTISVAGQPYYNSIAVDDAGRVHATWNELVPAAPDDPDQRPSPDIFYRRSSDGGETWSDAVTLSASPEGSTKPQITAGGDGQLHVVWDEGYDSMVGKGRASASVYRRSRDGGQTWEAPLRFVLPNDAPQQIVVGLLRGTVPVIVYRATQAPQCFYHAWLADAGRWTETAALQGVRPRHLGDGPFDAYAMTTDAAGGVHLFMVGFLAEDDVRRPPRLLHFTWDGRMWTPPETVMGNDLYPEWPRAAVGHDGVLHLTWFTRSADDRFRSERANYRVWYSRRVLETRPSGEVRAGRHAVPLLMAAVLVAGLVAVALRLRRGGM
jgi:hypothetical protein